MSYLNRMIRSPYSIVSKKAYIKRRDAVTGLFESDWYEITEDVEKWGKIRTSVDFKKQNKLVFNNLSLKLANDTGKYNFNDDKNSIWFGYASEQRTLFKIVLNFIEKDFAGGVYTNLSIPSESEWDGDETFWDASIWDEEYEPLEFTGLLSGDIDYTDKNSVTLIVKPLTQVFIDFPARLLTGWTATGATASKFCEMLRDQTDGAGSFIFRPFLGDTTSNWEIATTTTIYPELNSASNKDIIDKNCWEVLEKLSEAEQFVPYVKGSGVFKFISKYAITDSGYSFKGMGFPDTEFGITIKKIKKLRRKVTDLYTSVQVKFAEENTSTSYVTREGSLVVSGGNAAWTYGLKPFKIDNNWIADTATADTIANNVFDELSDLKKEIVLTTPFIPHLNVLEEVNVSYDSSPVDPGSLWNQNNWNDELTWDSSDGDALALTNAKFKLFSIAVDLDKLENEFIARES